MADARSSGPQRGGARHRLLERMARLKQGGPEFAKPKKEGRRADDCGFCSGCWCGRWLFPRGAALGACRKKAWYVRPGPAAQKRDRWVLASLRRLLQKLAVWRRRYLRRRKRPEKLEEIPLLAPDRVVGD
ncbi:uncharacterized protein C1orf202 homolog [Kogia breviceps]|uniref:uncharacterized protein C1orf202 homolog n=1 Tax=Kogia breviceps TaxID=27615 RepID=UPI002795E8CD|nr:uncharacterized protein C1orf202 homolog [Kogia breviceps]